jgi:hypothetical protein
LKQGKKEAVEKMKSGLEHQMFLTNTFRKFRKFRTVNNTSNFSNCSILEIEETPIRGFLLYSKNT